MVKAYPFRLITLEWHRSDRYQSFSTGSRNGCLKLFAPFGCLMVAESSQVPKSNLNAVKLIKELNGSIINRSSWKLPSLVTTGKWSLMCWEVPEEVPAWRQILSLGQSADSEVLVWTLSKGPGSLLFIFHWRGGFDVI